MNLPVSLAAATDTGEKSPADFAKSGSAFQINAADRDHLNCYERIPDLTGQNSLILSLISTREISRYGRQIYVFGIIWIAVIIILISAALLFTLEKTVLSRLSWLRRAIDAAGGAQMDAGSMSRIRTSGHDEVAAVADDINRLLTAIEQTTERAEKSEQEYKLLFDKMQSGFAVHEIVRDAGKAAIDYRFLDVNPAFEKLTGLAREAVIGRTARELLPGLEPLWIDRYGRVVQTGQPDHFEEFNASLDKHFDVMAFRTGDNRFAVTFTDITERKKAEAERAQAQQDLAQIQKMEVVGQLASGVAHDFNNQMTSVLGYADLLRDELAANRDFTRARFAENIIKGIERARDLTKQLLAFARKGKNRSEPVDMHDVIIEVVGMLKRSLDKNILLVKKLDAASAIIMGDRNQLQNVILNIAINASDAMPAGGQLTFATTTETLDAAFCERYPREVTPGRYLRISITDTGTGIDAETAKHIFEPFFTTKPPGKGTGMGLAAALGTVKHHRGIITVDSAPLSGSAFNIYLPACEEKIIKGEATRKIPAIPGNPHLLVVDDEETVAEVARELLEKMGCEVTHCRSGREAIEYYSKSWQQINLVILDIMMPEMNGKEVLPLLIKINPEVRVIVSSGYSMNEDAQAMIRDGAIDFLQKPYRSSTLSAAIIGALKT
jgi:PAS domain S-box-containing protein